MPLSKKELELLAVAPDDVERHLVLADRLQASGDPRGELIALQLKHAQAAVAGSPSARSLERAAERHLKAHAKRLLGGLWTATSSSQFTWRLGFIRAATLWTTAVALPPTLGRRVPKLRANKLLKLVDELLDHESAALLERLTLATSFNSQVFLWDAAARVAQGAPQTLRVLALRDLYERALPDWDTQLALTTRWRGRPLELKSDSLSLQAVAELFS
jgi:uncharacterized protein (TIGR02996 family)